MEISKDTQEVLNFLDYTTGNNLLKRNDLAVILEIGASSGNHPLVNKIIFAGKSVRNISQMIRREGTTSQNFDMLYNELRKNCIELAAGLSSLVTGQEENLRQRFANVYLSGTDGAERNLIDLSHDLAALRDLQLEMKRASEK